MQTYLNDLSLHAAALVGSAKTDADSKMDIPRRPSRSPSQAQDDEQMEAKAATLQLQQAEGAKVGGRNGGGGGGGDEVMVEAEEAVVPMDAETDQEALATQVSSRASCSCHHRTARVT